MFARIARHEGGDTEQVRRMNEQRMASGDMGLPDGCRRVMVLAGDDHRLFITFFDDKAAMAAAETRFEEMGNEIPEEVRGRRASVDVYEAVIDQQA